MRRGIGWAAAVIIGLGGSLVGPAAQAPARCPATPSLAGSRLIGITDATPAARWWVARSPSAALATIIRLWQGACPQAAPSLVPAPPGVFNAYLGPAALYLRLPGGATARLAPATELLAGPGGRLRRHYFPGLLSWSERGRARWFHAPALVQWLRSGRWQSGFTLATAVSQLSGTYPSTRKR